NQQSGFVTNHVYEFKIKIYKKEGLSWANQRVSYYVGYENLRDDKVSFSAAATYNIENDKIVKTKLNSEGNFTNKINKYWNVATITLPNVKVGSVIEYKYTLKSENVVRLPDFDFQYDIPVNYFEYKTEIPEFFIYKTLLVGDFKPESSAEVVNISQIYASNYKQINSFYTAKDIPALKEEPFINNIENYKGSIRNELERQRFPDKPVVDYTNTWEGVTGSIYKDLHLERELSTRDYFEEDLKTLLQNINSPKEKLDVVFKFVQDRMNWNKEYGYYTKKELKKAYSEKTGNVAEINLMLVAMLKFAKLEANPVLVSTVENGVPFFPTRTIFNYVIAAVEIDGTQVLLDATNKFTVPDILPLNVLNWQGRLIKADGSSKEIELIPSKASKCNYNINTTILPDSGELKGTMFIQNSDNDALHFREINSVKTNENLIDKLEQDLNGIEIEDYSVENLKQNLEKPVSEKFEFVSNRSYERIGNKIFLNPALFFAHNKNPFIQEKRQMPIYFGYPNQKKYNVIFEIPNGYIVESIPKPIKVSTDGNGFSYMMNIVAEDDKIQIRIVEEINKAIFVADDYDMLKDFFQKVIEIQSTKIVLKKI
ncbi:MAG: DUF3857 domain-containing protein, partial [Flavobacterium sp.]